MSGARPSSVGVGLTAATAIAGTLSTLLAGVWVGLLGVVLAIVGVYRGSRRLLGVGVATLFAGVVFASLLGVPAWLLVPAMAGTVLAWDVGENTIAVAEQFSNGGATWRGETLHALLSTILVATFAGAVFLVYSLSVGGFPLLAVVMLVVGALLLLVGLGR